MAFEVRYTIDPAGTLTTKNLIPAPTDIDYPPKRLFEKKETADGAVVIQRHKVDGRPRKWIWKGYRDTIAGYNALWDILTALEVKTRLDADLEPTVEIKDTTTGVGGFESFVRVKVINVDRTIRDGGGPATYDDTVMEFVIADSNYTAH